jgi:sphingomyelin phosphodiesterase D
MMHSKLFLYMLAACSCPITNAQFFNADTNQHVLAPDAGHMAFNDQSHSQTSASAPKPFYIISHRTLTVRGVDAAVEDGANAIEIDARSYSGGWRAAHDAILGSASAGDDMRTMFDAIAAVQKTRKSIAFVWLDIKTPDECTPDAQRHCSIRGLQDLARDILEPAGVRVLYGISAQGPSIRILAESLNGNEALGLDCEAGDVSSLFGQVQPIDQSKMVYSCGLFDMSLALATSRYRNLLGAIASGKYGKTFGWTVSAKDDRTIQELGSAGVDGLIYAGTPANAYASDSIIGKVLGLLWTLGRSSDQRANEKSAQRKVADWVRQNPEKSYLAKADDYPW